MTDMVAEHGGEIDRVRGPRRAHAGAYLELNTATIRDIERLPVMTPGLARDLIASRPFRTWADLGKVNGFCLALVEELVLSGVSLQQNDITIEQREP
ncbi:MAG: hypothetical protein EOO77_40535 [Oxalobacteraceae bacterium]|nr:MAG: hypothetical protein EOO77_40535 [Oxalobacteraceae bacterium]